MCHRYGRLPHEIVPGCPPGSWSALIVDMAVYRAGENMRKNLPDGAVVFPVWSL